MPPASVSLHNVLLMLGPKSCSDLPLHSIDELTPAFGRNDIHITCAPGPPNVEALEVYGRKQNATKGKTLKKRRGRTESSCPQRGIARIILRSGSVSDNNGEI